MDPPKKHPTAEAASRPEAAAAAKKPTTLLDAYEVECIRRELERLLKKNSGVGSVASSKAVADTHGGHHHGSTKKTSAKNANPAPAPPAKKGSGRGVRLLGRHAVAICGAAMPVATAGTAGRRRRRGAYREVEKV